MAIGWVVQGLRRKSAGVRALAAWLALSLSLGACVGPDFMPPAPPVIGAFTPERLPKSAGAGGKTQRLELERALPSDWWALFHSAALNGLIARALRDNPTVEAAQAALRVAQANVYAEVGQLFPLASGSYEGQGGKVATSPATGGVSAPVVAANGANPLNRVQRRRG